MDPKIIGQRIKTLLNQREIKRSYLANKMGISYNTLTKKLNGQQEFSAIEVSKIKFLLELDDELSANIFFNPNYEIIDNNDTV